MKIPKTPIAFDYDLWTTEDGKCMVRVKRTGEVSEVDRKVMRILRAEEKRIRRSYGSDNTSEDEDGAEKISDTVLSLDAMPEDDVKSAAWLADSRDCALPGFVDSKNEEKTERNAGYLVVSHSGGGMLRQGTRKGIRRTPANRGMRAHWVVKGLDISEDVCHGMCP